MNGDLKLTLTEPLSQAQAGSHQCLWSCWLSFSVFFSCEFPCECIWFCCWQKSTPRLLAEVLWSLEREGAIQITQKEESCQNCFLGEINSDSYHVNLVISYIGNFPINPKRRPFVASAQYCCPTQTWYVVGQPWLHSQALLLALQVVNLLPWGVFFILY